MKYKLHIEREDGKAGDEAFIVDDATSLEDAKAKALERTDPSFTKIVSVTKIG